MVIYLDKRGTITHGLSVTAGEVGNGYCNLQAAPTGVIPRHESWHCRGYLGGKKSLFCEFSQNRATHFLSQVATAPQPPPRPASDTFATWEFVGIIEITRKAFCDLLI
jgi:hypothetical protein